MAAELGEDRERPGIATIRPFGQLGARDSVDAREELAAGIGLEVPVEVGDHAEFSGAAVDARVETAVGDDARPEARPDDEADRAVVRLDLAEMLLAGGEAVGVVVDEGRTPVALFEIGFEGDLFPRADVLDVVDRPRPEVDDGGHAGPDPGHVVPHEGVDGGEEILEDVLH